MLYSLPLNTRNLTVVCKQWGWMTLQIQGESTFSKCSVVPHPISEKGNVYKIRRYLKDIPLICNKSYWNGISPVSTFLYHKIKMGGGWAEGRNFFNFATRKCTNSLCVKMNCRQSDIMKKWISAAHLGIGNLTFQAALWHLLHKETLYNNKRNQSMGRSKEEVLILISFLLNSF